MNNEVKLWLAGELGCDAFIDCDGDVAIGVCRYFDIESDTPEAAYLREKVVKWLGKYSIGIQPSVSGESFRFIARGVLSELPDLGIGVWTIYEQAIIAAIEWLYERSKA